MYVFTYIILVHMHVCLRESVCVLFASLPVVCVVCVACVCVCVRVCACVCVRVCVCACVRACLLSDLGDAC